MSKEEPTNETPKAKAKSKSTAKVESKGMLPKMEILTILVLFVSFLAWTLPKCSSTQQAYEEKEAKKKEDAPITSIAKEETLTETAKVDTSSVKTSTVAAPKTEKVTVLYVILDGLNLRTGHHLDSSILKTFKLNDEVYFLNSVTDFKQDINLGDRVVSEPWVKIRAYSGHEGWVYGAGVSYFKPPKEKPAVVDKKPVN